MKVLRRFVPLLLLLACNLQPAFAQRGPDSDSETTILTLEHEWTVGQAHSNIRALDLIFDNALVYVEYGRLVSKAEYLARIKHEAPQIVMEPMNVRVEGDTAIVVGSYRERMAGTGRSTAMRWRFIDTWVYQRNGWVLVSAAATPISE
jgi:hypothetical protein